MPTTKKTVQIQIRIDQDVADALEGLVHDRRYRSLTALVNDVLRDMSAGQHGGKTSQREREFLDRMLEFHRGAPADWLRMVECAVELFKTTTPTK